jgi:uncharacterized LabA/DUF88 family protein
MPHQERIAVFIDGTNLYATARSLELQIDFKALLDVFRNKGRLLRVVYYVALLGDEDPAGMRPFLDWLSCNGYCVVVRSPSEAVNRFGHRKGKCNMEIDMAVNVMELVPHLDHVVLISGDGDLCALVQGVQRKGVRVSVVSTARTRPAIVANDLRRQADEFIDLADLAPRLERDPGERASRQGLRERRVAVSVAT